MKVLKHGSIVNNSLQTEADWQKTLISYAHLMGWLVATFRPARVLRHGKETYETPVGADGRGWPDLVLVKTIFSGDTVILASELKSESGKISTSQAMWLENMDKVAGVFAFVWIPSQFQDISDVLQSKGLSDIIMVWKKHALFAKSRFGLNLATHPKE